MISLGDPVETCTCDTPEPGRDGFCRRCIGRLAPMPARSGAESSSAVLSGTVLTEPGATAENYAHSGPPTSNLGGIDRIVRRMWWWIGAQGLAVGIWAGNAFPGSRTFDDCSGWGGCSSLTVSGFGWNAFFSGLILGISAFAPLVFVVEAIREAIRNLVRD